MHVWRYYESRIIFVPSILIQIFCFLAGNGLENNILVVAMHPTETKKYNKIYNVIGTPNHPLHTLKMVTLLYSQDGIFDDDNSREAMRVIPEFFLQRVLQNHM